MRREFVPVPHATTQGMTQSAGNTRQANPPLRGRAAGTLLESYENCSQMARRLLLRVENRSRGSRATKVTQVTRSFCRSVFVAQRVRVDECALCNRREHIFARDDLLRVT